MYFLTLIKNHDGNFLHKRKTDFLASANRSIIDSIHKSCYTLQLSYPIKECNFFFQIRILNFGSTKNNHIAFLISSPTEENKYCSVDNNVIPYLFQKISGDKL